MLTGTYKQGRDGRSYAWKERTYVVPTPSRKGFQWKASALRNLHKLGKADVTGHPVTVVVPALYNLMPAEALALGWLNEIDALGAIRHRILEASRVTGWDVFTFHTRHNLDSYYSSTIDAVRETWLHEGSLNPSCIAETVKRYGKAYQYNRIPARLVENLVFQSSLMGWLTSKAADAPLRFHSIGTALLSTLVWARALSFKDAVRVALRTGSQWDAKVTEIAEEELRLGGTAMTDETLGWQRFGCVRRILEGQSVISMGVSMEELPMVDAPSRPFWFSVIPGSEPVLIETARDARHALESLNLASWSPAIPKALPAECVDRIRGWLVSPQHPIASACKWSVYNYLLATPSSTMLFLDHIAALGRRPVLAENTEVFQDRLRLSRMKVTGP